jgi:hypothetical protein
LARSGKPELAFRIARAIITAAFSRIRKARRSVFAFERPRRRHVNRTSKRNPLARMLLGSPTTPYVHAATIRGTMMMTRTSSPTNARRALPASLAILAAACTPIAQQYEAAALSTAERRAAFEM